MRLATTYRQPGVPRFGRPGGAWDVPSLDRLLASPRPAASAAVFDGEVTIDHGALDAAASAVAGGLRALGVRRGDVVAWQLPNWWEAIVLFHACWRMRRGGRSRSTTRWGRARSPGCWTTWIPPSRWRPPACPSPSLVDAIGVRPATPGSTRCSPGGRAGAGHGARMSPSCCSPRGRPGNPKAVLHSHRGLAYKAATMVRAHGLTPDDVALMPSPLAHISGLLNSVLVPGSAAMPVVLMEKWDAGRGRAAWPVHTGPAS